MTKKRTLIFLIFIFGIFFLLIPKEAVFAIGWPGDPPGTNPGRYPDSGKSCSQVDPEAKRLCHLNYAASGQWYLTFIIPRELAGGPNGEITFPLSPRSYRGEYWVPSEMREADVFEQAKTYIENSCLGGEIIVNATNDKCMDSDGAVDMLRNIWGSWGRCITPQLFFGVHHNIVVGYGLNHIPIKHCDPLENTTVLSISSENKEAATSKDRSNIELRINENCKSNCGQEYTVSWSSTNPGVSCQLKGKMPNNFKSTDTSGSITFYPPDVQRGIYTHILTCTGILDGSDPSLAYTGSITKTAVMYVGYILPKPTVDIEADSLEIKKGESITLTWSSTNAASVDINQGIGLVGPSGTLKKTPKFTTRYSITASGGEFSEPGLARDSVTVKVIAPDITPPPEDISEPPPDVTPPPVVEPEKPELDLKVNGSDGPLTMQTPSSFTLSWNLSRYCLAYGSWLGIKTKAGEQIITKEKAGNYNFKLYCPGVGSDSVSVKLVSNQITTDGGGKTTKIIPMPKAEASISSDGRNFSRSIRITKGEPIELWLSAAYDVTGDGSASHDDSGRWTSSLSMGGRCEWNYDLNRGNPTFEAATFDPQDAKECTIPLGEVTSYNDPGVYRIGALRLVQNNGKVSSVSYINMAVLEPPPPDTPPIIDLRINSMEGERVTLGAPAKYFVNWNVRNADSCVASDNWEGDKDLRGSQKFVASEKKGLIYTLTCEGLLGTTTQSVFLKVAELPICEFSALPTWLNKKSVFERQSVLSWKCQYANTCLISPTVGAVDTFGSTRVSPSSTTKYTLACSNLEGESRFDALVEVR